MIEIFIVTSIVFPVIMLCVAAQHNQGDNPYYYITRGQLIILVLIMIIPVMNFVLMLYILGAYASKIFNTSKISDWLQGHPFRKDFK